MQTPDKKRCRQCKRVFTPERPDQLVCGVKCAIKWGPGYVQRMKKERLKTLSDHHKALQSVFNRYIRLRDQHLPCVSCGRFHKGQWHAGHFLSIGSHPELRYCEDNVHKQCAPCNNHKSGDIKNYRESLIQRIGEDRLAWLEGPHDPRKYTREELIDLRREYLQKIKEIEAYFPSDEGF